MTKRLAILLGCIAIAVLVIGNVAAYSTAAAKPQPSKVAYIIQERIVRIDNALKTQGVNGRLPVRVAESLSDPLLQVNFKGDLLLEYHSAQAIGPNQINSLKARGGQIVITTADLIWPKGMKMPPGLGIIVVWMPYNRVMSAAEQLSWVVAVTPVENNPPDAFLSEGVTLHSADVAQSLGIDGAGVTVGVISNGIENLAASQALGELPAVTVPPGCSSGEGDEGTAMLEIVHDMAPGAALQFCATGRGVVSHTLAQNNLVASGVDVIAEDTAFDSQPAFQYGEAASNGDAIAAAGVSMHSSAGNLGDQHAARVAATGTGGGPDGSAGPFDDCAFTPDNVVAIAPGGDTTFDVDVQPGANGTTFRATLQWTEPRAIFPTADAGGFTDLNLYVMDAGLTACLGSSAGVQGGGDGDTIEQVSIDFPAGPDVRVKLVVDVENQPAGVATPTIDLRWRGRLTSHDASTRTGSLNPDSNYTGLATSSAAADAGTSINPGIVPLEGSSAGGPIQLWLTTVCPGGVYPCAAGVAGPAATTAGAPTWTAADGVTVSGVGGFGSPFFGTSAAAPHAAACDALVRDNVGAAATVAGISARLAASARDRGAAGVDNEWGAGVLNCLLAAVQTDLALTKSDSPDPVIAGTQLNYDLKVTNNGPDNSPGLVVTDTLPAGVAFVSSPDGCAETAPGSGVVVCTAASLANGSNTTFHIVTLVDASLVYNAGGPIVITNTATVAGIGLDPNLANNSAAEGTLVIAQADLSASKTAVTNPVIAGTDETYHITVTNNGPSDAQNVSLSDAIPANTTFVSLAQDSGPAFTCTTPPVSAGVSCTLARLPAGASAAFTLVVHVLSSAPDGSTIANTANVSTTTTDPNLANNSGAVTVGVITRADLSVSKTATTDPVIAGTDETYHITVTNNGPSDAQNVTLSDAIPANTTFVSLAQDAGLAFTCTTPPVSAGVSCTLATLPAGASAAFTLVVHVLSSAPDGSTIVNTADVSATTTDPNLANNSGAVTVGVITRADLSVSKSQAKNLVIADINQTYHLTFVNNGPSDAQIVTLSDPTPANTTFVSLAQDSGPAFTCATPPVGGTGDVTCTIPTFVAGASASFTLVVRISPVDTNFIRNTVSVRSSTVDPNPANNAASVTAKVSIAEWKKAVLTDLTALRGSVTDKQVGQKLDQAIRRLSNSLDPSLWVSGNTLDAKRGNRVFSEEKDAVVFMTDLIKTKDGGLAGVLRGYVDRLIAADHALADIALHQAMAAGGAANLIRQATNELALGDNNAGAGKFNVAIEHYRNAWQHSQQAMKK